MGLFIERFTILLDWLLQSKNSKREKMMNM